MANILNVAQYVISKTGEITTLKLQKLVYYCQAWSLAWDGKPLFNEDFEAWANGPVNPRLFREHQGRFTIDEHFFDKYKYNGFTDDEKETMDIVINDLGEKDSQWLSDLTHSERPWKEARAGCLPGERCSNVISKEVMQDYYSGLIQ